MQEKHEIPGARPRAEKPVTEEARRQRRDWLAAKDIARADRRAERFRAMADAEKARGDKVRQAEWLERSRLAEMERDELRGLAAASSKMDAGGADTRFLGRLSIYSSRELPFSAFDEARAKCPAALDELEWRPVPPETSGAVRSLDLSPEKKVRKTLPEVRFEDPKTKAVTVVPEEKRSFHARALVLAKEIERRFGIPWQVTFGQSVLESGHGQSKAAKEFGNYFGHKARPGSAHKKVLLTKEFYDGKEREVRAEFESYADVRESFAAHGEFLLKKRYRKAFGHAYPLEPRPEWYPADYDPKNYDPAKFLAEIKAAGYATDPEYVKKILGVTERYGTPDPSAVAAASAFAAVPAPEKAESVPETKRAPRAGKPRKSPWKTHMGK